MFTVREWRRLKGIPQKEMATALGVSTQTIVAWEKNPAIISIGKCYEIADALGVKFEDIIFLPKDSIIN